MTGRLCRVVRVRDGDQRKFVDSSEVSGVAGMEREIVGDGDGGDHGVVGACGWFAARVSETCGNSTEAAGCVCVKRQRFEIGFGLLDVCLSGGSFAIGRRDKRAHRELGEGDRGDQRLGWVMRNSEQGQRSDCCQLGGPQGACTLSQGRASDVVGSARIAVLPWPAWVDAL